MPELLPLQSWDDVRPKLDGLATRLSTHQDRMKVRAALIEAHGALMQVAAGEQSPTSELAEVAVVVALADDVAVNRLPARIRVVMRLLQTAARTGPSPDPGVLEAAWLVLIDNSAGVVADLTTRSGAARAQPRQPFVSHVDGAKVFAWLPGFRDPRYTPPDSCYEITSLVRLRGRVDTIGVDDGGLWLAGSASLAHVDTTPDEQVHIVATKGNDVHVSAPGVRLRRSDLAAGTGIRLTSPVWSGWRAHIPQNKLVVEPGSWQLHLQLRHRGIRRRIPLGRDVSDLAAACAPLTVRTRRATAILRFSEIDHGTCHIEITRHMLPRFTR